MCNVNIVSNVLHKGIAAAKQARRIMRRVPFQYPCRIRHGNLQPHPSYQADLDTGTRVSSYTSRLCINDLPTLKLSLQKANIAIAAPVEGETSHGVVSFVTIGPDRIRGVMKLMALPKPATAEASIVAQIHDSSFLDSYLAGLGSSRVAEGTSIGFAHVFGTFLAKTTLRGVADTPVVVLITERFDALLDSKITACMANDAVQWRRLVGLVLQVMTILAQGQAMFGLVHNDAHLGNFMVTATDAASTSSTHAYISTSSDSDDDMVLRLPLRERVTLIDFGRSSLGTAQGRRIASSEVREKFPKWEKNGMEADVMHFAAMLVLIQPRAGYLEEHARKPDAPACALALIRLIWSALQCGAVDMYDSYNTCAEDTKTNCAHTAIHFLRKKSSHCVGATPESWLNDAELTGEFRTPVRWAQPCAPRVLVAQPH